MTARFSRGQKVTVVPVKYRPVSPRDSDIEPYVGQRGEVIDYYWLRPGTSDKFFYIYLVRIGKDKKEIVLHEDEIEACIE